jgi:hypothetical protein
VIINTKVDCERADVKKLSRGKNSAKQQEEYLLRWRRQQVASMWFEGTSVKDIASILKVDERTIYRDMEYIENNADELMRNYIVKTVPHIINRSLYQLDFANREAMKVLKDPNSDKKIKLAASLAVAKTAKDVVDIVTNNDDFVDAALELDESLKEEAEEYLGISQDGIERETKTENSNRKF